MSLGVFGRLWSDSLSRQTRRYSQGKRKEQVSRALAQPYVMDRGLDEGESPERRSASKVEVSRPSKEPREAARLGARGHAVLVPLGCLDVGAAREPLDDPLCVARLPGAGSGRPRHLPYNARTY